MSPPGLRRMRADARRNYESLLATAHAMFSEHGTDASLEEIARRAGLGIGTLYRHFPTREALLEALLHDRMEGLAAEAGALLADPSPRAALWRWLTAFTERAFIYRGLPASVMATLRDETSELAASCHRLNTAGAALIRRAQDAGEIRADVAPADVMAMAGAIAWVGEQTPDDPERRSRLLTLLADGLTTGA
ncbi:TetR family transcriptional regulator [Spongiactinospora gelatinilytica]|uniref:TetR family transcriptional regulator n=1 Tax=Spongiactinospora gelatinilytica TaxID=2666298 RepID=A0A2W2GT09_9ACTN|nr:TetR/AcrR family transcriptional regulator [Spongiactinospora gelatinilytica]PZG51541.1 TetR family transcriptional regulator [Spongiactinospora gelatinilytica]